MLENVTNSVCQVGSVRSGRSERVAGLKTKAVLFLTAFILLTSTVSYRKEMLKCVGMGIYSTEVNVTSMYGGRKQISVMKQRI